MVERAISCSHMVRLDDPAAFRAILVAQREFLHDSREQRWIGMLLGSRRRRAQRARGLGAA